MLHIYSLQHSVGGFGTFIPVYQWAERGDTPFMTDCCSSYVDVIEQAVVSGDTVLIENLEETIDPVLNPLLGRHTIKKGR